YRAEMNFTWEALDAAQTALDKLYEAATELTQIAEHTDIEYEREFLDAVGQDLNMARALSIMWDMLGSAKVKPDVKAATLLKMDEVLGLNIEQNSKRLTRIPPNIMKMVEERQILRK